MTLKGCAITPNTTVFCVLMYTLKITMFQAPTTPLSYVKAHYTCTCITATYQKKSTPWGHETYYLLFFDPDLTPRDKMKIPEPYCTSSTRHTQSYPRVSFVISMNCTEFQ